LKKQLGDYNCTNFQQWKEAVLDVAGEDRGV
jgi:hypothetical protein